MKTTKILTLHIEPIVAVFFGILLFCITMLVPISAHAGTASITATPNSNPLYTGGTVTITWSSSDTFRCDGTGFSTAGAKSGSVTQTVSGSGTKTYAITCQDDTPMCSLVLTSSYVDDAPYPNNCTGSNAKVSYSSSGSCYVKGVGCTTSVSKGSSTWTNSSYQCQGSCSSVTQSTSVTVYDPPPPPTPSVTLSASPSVVTAGNSVLISWSSASATSCTGTGFSTGGNTSGSVTITPTTTKTYSITCDSTTYSSTPGTYHFAYSDVTDLWCTQGPPPPSYSNYYTDNDCPTSNPEGTACVGSETCAVNTWSGGPQSVGGPTNYCNLKSDVYRCNGGSAPNQITDTASVVYNHAPNAPTISGSTSGSTNTAYSYSFKASDPDGNQVRYQVDWNNDGVVDQYLPSSGYVTSNTSQSGSHTWTSVGTYAFKARTQDGYGALSSWTSYSVTISDPCVAVCSGSDLVNSCTNALIQSCAYGCSGGACSSAQCANGIDDDGDGLIDTADYGCSSGSDNSEFPNPQCSDGIDNNGNGKIDYPADPACTSYTDNNEQVQPSAAITLVSNPVLARIGMSANLVWNAANVMANSCSLAGTNGDSWSLTGVSGTRTTSALSSETIFTLSCDDLNGDPVSTATTVKIAPSFQEF